MRDATVAIEDRRFFDHKGVDFEGVVRAAVKNISSGETVQGGSTLSMQLIRNLYTGDRERNFKRKLREARLAEELENAHPGRAGKLWILNQYINNVPYGTSGGQSAVGVQAAARIYFSKPARELTLPEAALLAGLPQAPTTYNPISNPQGAMTRRNNVLRQMAAERMITGEQANAAIASPLGVIPGRFYRQRREGYFFDFVRQELIDKYGVNTTLRGGLKVYTALEPRFQKAARIALNQSTAGLDRSAAIVSIDPRTGYIRTMASTGYYGKFKFNLAAQGRYAAGSTFKVMVLMAALERGIDPKTTFYTSKPLKFVDPTYGNIDVKTYSGSYIGRANLVTATLRSDNSIYQQLDLDVGPEKVAEVAKKMGITTKLDGIPAEGLGGLRLGVSPLEMASAYATIASYGYATKPTAITKVCIPRGADGDFECQENVPAREKVFSDGVAAAATEILKANITGGTGGAASIGCPVAGKTGTVDDFTDAWFVGYTPQARLIRLGRSCHRATTPRLWRRGRRDGGADLRPVHEDRQGGLLRRLAGAEGALQAKAVLRQVREQRCSRRGDHAPADRSSAEEERRHEGRRRPPSADRDPGRPADADDRADRPKRRHRRRRRHIATSDSLIRVRLAPDMTKEEKVEFEGEVMEALPNAMFTVKLDNGHEVLGHVAGKMRRFRIRILPGDRVRVEVSPYDLDRARIIFRYR